MEYSINTLKHFFGNGNKMTFFPIRSCSMCEEEIGYRINNGNVFFDSSCGCGCTSTLEDLLPKVDKFVDISDEELICRNA